MDSEARYQIEVLEEPFLQSDEERIGTFLDSLSVERETFRLSLDQICSAHTLCVLARKEAIVVGLAGLRKRGMSRVLFMVVHRNYQGEGVGNLLMSGLMSQVGSSKCVMLSVQCENYRAIGLYEKYGFKTIFTSGDTLIMVYKNLIGKLCSPVLALGLWLRSSIIRTT